MGKISPSYLTKNSRCYAAGAYNRMTDPRTGERYKAEYGTQTQSRFDQGNFFESVLLGTPHVSRHEEEHERWLAWNNKKSTLLTREKLLNYGLYCSKLFDANGEKQVELSYTTEEGLWLYGWSDYIGPHLLEDHGVWEKLVVDCKLTEDISQVWDIGGKASGDAKLFQVPFYCLTRALMLSTDPSLFFKGLSLFQQGAPLDQVREVGKAFVATTELLNGCYFVCEAKDSGDVPIYRQVYVNMNRDTASLFKFFTNELQAADLIWAQIEYAISKREMNKLENEKDGGKRPIGIPASLFEPSEFACLGKGRGGMLRGRCEFLNACEFGRSVLGGVHRNDLGDWL